MMDAILYGLPHCSTCKKAVALLEERGVNVREYRDLKSEPLDEAEVRELAERVGGVERLFSRRARKYRSMGLHERDLSEAERLALMSEEYTFITRPVVVTSGGAVAGFAPRRLEALLEGSAG